MNMSKDVRLPSEIRRSVQAQLPGATEMAKVGGFMWVVTWRGTAIKVTLPTISYMPIGTKFKLD